MAVMIGIALSTRASTLELSAVQGRAYALRRWWLTGLVVVFATLFAITIPSFPYLEASELSTARHIPVMAEQYAFPVPAVLPVNTPIVFDVTAKDVNHGFGIYDPENRILAQVQAMPNYVNHLAVEFKQRGKYTVRCLEFCGVGHAYMQAAFEVR
ncbi:cytochrome C oxidase subunit II [bacterium]|nr:MAG: cytochrome C oxidase subunit II [bacterium]